MRGKEYHKLVSSKIIEAVNLLINSPLKQFLLSAETLAEAEEGLHSFDKLPMMIDDRYETFETENARG